MRFRYVLMFTFLPFFLFLGIIWGVNSLESADTESLRYALVTDGIVTNVIKITVSNAVDFTIEKNQLLIHSDLAAIGDIWDGRVFARPSPLTIKTTFVVNDTLDKLDVESVVDNLIIAVCSVTICSRELDSKDRQALVDTFLVAFTE